MKKRRISVLVALGIKGILCLICLSVLTFTFALVTYTETATINPIQQFTQGTTGASWNIYVNEVNQVKYLPGGVSESTLNVTDSNTYAFKVVTDGVKVCAVKIELTGAVDSSKFSNFQITVRSSTGSAWSDETVYAAETGATTKPYIDGLIADSGYIHQALSTIVYYEIKVIYSYDKVDSTTQLPITFRFTPLPQDSFA